MKRCLAAAGFAALLLGPSCSQAADPPAPGLHVGLRRSTYGLRAKNADDAWWAARAKAYARTFGDPGTVRPVVIQIVSTYQDDGTSRFGFKRPDGWTGADAGMRFGGGGIDHERALATYDREGVGAVLQIEPGSADVTDSLALLHRVFGRHPCVVGFGVDAEWYRTKASKDKTGVPIPDDEARKWMEAVSTLGPSYKLFLKHWRPSHMPPTYRHPRLWFLSDSQQFKNLEGLLDDFSRWGRAFGRETVGYQFGYPKDRPWWGKMKQPPREIGEAVRRRIPNTRWLFWVDFTADAVKFGE
jgi:hypothetical protein